MTNASTNNLKIAPIKDELQDNVDIGEWLGKNPRDSFESYKNESVTVIEEEGKLGRNFEGEMNKSVTAVEEEEEENRDNEKSELVTVFEEELKRCGSIESEKNKPRSNFEREKNEPITAIEEGGKLVRSFESEKCDSVTAIEEEKETGNRVAILPWLRRNALVSSMRRGALLHPLLFSKF
jgi:hypothetical protein